ncbi:unnamed protein product [Prorocentrum cordatum]|uniref:Uncharacterized protein n=1 Tax=Prorocentrum cordatum TaxID=2364126 RepID=A0ABN9U793_9DINO|nr:unnamed protein product [Polarella glacialis]
MVRCFEDPDITHVDGSVDPARDIETINLELIIADITQLENRKQKLIKDVRGKVKGAQEESDVLDKILAVLEEGKPARSTNLNEDEQAMVKKFSLITMKKVLYAANVAEEDLGTGGARGCPRGAAQPPLVIFDVALAWMKTRCTVADLRKLSDGRSRHTESNSDIGTLHGCNVFEVFGVTKLAELNTSSRFSIPGRILVVALSSMSSASFSIHGLLVSQRWSPGYVFPRPEFEIGTAAFLEWLENGAVAFIYFVLGVIFPMLTRHKHVQLERTLSVANRYSWAEAEANLISRYANICFSYVVWSATFVLGMFAPVLIWLPRLYGDDITEQIRVCFWVEVSVFIWSISMLFIGPSRVEEIGTKAVESVVAGVCKELDDMSTESIRWERVLSIVKATDYLLADTFQWSCLGRLVVVRVSMLFSLAAGFGCVGIVHYNEATRKGAMC